LRRLKSSISNDVMIRFANLRCKFIDPSGQLKQHAAEMFVKPTKPMIAAAALKRVAWHVILHRRDF